MVPREGESRAKRPIFVLVVDDMEDNRDLFASYLEYGGFRVAQAEDGEAALAAITPEKPDVVLMDLSMPHMDGWEATRLIKSNPRTKDIVVIVVTAYDSPSILERARAAGADDVLTKPCTPDALVEVIRENLGRSGR
jgi:two-component system, cell cycle response regulator DivK